jgi:hypothetical protein
LVSSIRKIGVGPITHDPEYVTGYGMKGLKRRSFFEDETHYLSHIPAKITETGPKGVQSCTAFIFCRKTVKNAGFSDFSKGVQLCTPFSFA